MNLVCRKSKIREKTDLGAWGRRQGQSGDWGRLSGCFSQIREIQIREIREKTDFRGGKGDLERERERERGGGGSDNTCIVSLYNRSRQYRVCTVLSSRKLYMYVT